MRTTGTIRAHDDGTVTTVTLAGEIDAALSEESASALAWAAAAGLPMRLDLADVLFLDSTGVGFLLDCHRACTARGVPCTLSNVPDRVSGTLRILGLERLLTIVPAQATRP